MKYLLSISLALALLASPLAGFSQKKKSKGKGEEQEMPEGKDIRQAESQFLSGMKYYMLEDYEKAMLYFKKAHALYPNSAGTNFQIAQLYLGFGDARSAEPYAAKALSLNDSNIYYFQLLAQCYLQIADNAKAKERQSYLKKAAQVYETMVRKHPQQDDAYFELANIYMQLGDVNEGIKAINKIEKKYGVTEEISFEKRNIFLRLNKFDEAAQEGEKLIAAFPEEPRYRVEQAQLYFANSRTEEAKKMLLELEQNGQLTGQGKVLLSDVYWTLGEKEKSNQALLDAFSDPDYPAEQKVNIVVGFMSSPGRLSKEQIEQACRDIIALHPLEAKGYVALGDFLLHDLKRDEARTAYMKALQLDPSFYQVWLNVVIIDSELEEQDSIIRHTEQAIEVFPNQGAFWFYQGNAHLLKKNYTEAADAFERAKKLTRTNPGLLMVINAQLGDAYNSLKDYEKSDAAYEEVLAMDPNYTHVLNNYSYFLSLRNERLEVAVAMCERLLKIEPYNSTYLDTYAWVLYKQNNLEKSRDLLEQALKNSTDGTIIEHYGDVLYKLGNTQKAIEQWKLAQSKGEESELLEKKIADGKLYE